MEAIIQERMTAQIEGEPVLFLTGMRINRWWRVGEWLWVMPSCDRWWQMSASSFEPITRPPQRPKPAFEPERRKSSAST